ncbi:hypothetical protein AB0K00_45680 [Dactylosporangium sp. NPDC049525]|uniref:hypothetical protein n=1 Tax=Dactylosporangium sp. NPDC049525 TaxID=3154730 RepID=UPI0034168045
MSNRTKLRPAPRRGPIQRGAAPASIWRRLALPAAALVVGGLLGWWIVAATSDPRTDAQQRIDALQVAEVQRDTEQVVRLTDQARRNADMLAPVMEAMYAALPAGAASPGPLATAAQVEGWKAVTRKVVSDFADAPSAGTAVNVARSGFATGARQLDLAVDTYTEAVKATDAQRPALLALAARQRDSAVVTWSIGGTQLDSLNVDTGHGHQHVFLPSAPGQGAMTSDGSKEGN